MLIPTVVHPPLIRDQGPERSSILSGLLGALLIFPYAVQGLIYTASGGSRCVALTFSVFRMIALLEKVMSKMYDVIQTFQ